MFYSHVYQINRKLDIGKRTILVRLYKYLETRTPLHLTMS